MLVQLLDDTEYYWKPHLKANAQLAEKKSHYHVAARLLLKELFPTQQILEEVWVPLRQKDYCYLDFYLPLIRMAVEVQGQQHYKFNSFFHENERDFLLQNKKDRDKKAWLKLNQITLVELPYNEKIEEWKNRIIKS